MKKLQLLIKTAFLFACCISHTALKAQHLDSALFSYTGSLQKWAVPGCVTQITCYMWGAGTGGNSIGGYPNSGAAGGFMAAVVNVSGLDTLGVVVGQAPQWGTYYPYGTYGGGGATMHYTYPFCAGGGRSALQVSGNDILTAGGAGGAGGTYSCSYYGNGGGGGVTGGSGTSSCTCSNDYGMGGSQSAGGVGGISCKDSSGNGNAGSQYQGGRVPDTTGTYLGGAGGGGYYGGGSGATYYGGGGGGGSSYPAVPTVYVTTIMAEIQGSGNANGSYTTPLYPGDYNVAPYSTYWKKGGNSAGEGAYLNNSPGNGLVAILYDCSTRINDLEIDKIELKVFPNPNNGSLMLSGLKGNSFIEIYNVLGQKVYSASVEHSNNLQIYMGKVTPGIYVCRVLNESGSIAGEVKFAIE